MSEVTLLEIHLEGSRTTPLPGSATWNEHRGGPAVLLRWLETQLGLLEDRPALASRILEYAAVLDGVPDSVFAPSLATDRWATAGELLSRRDELRLACWDEADSAGLPPLVRDMARAAQMRTARLPDESARLQRVLEALGAGQVLPPHRCLLGEDATRWPRRWRAVLEWLQTERAGASIPEGPASSSLAAVQQQVLEGTLAPAPPDAGLRWLRSRSVLGACEAVAAALAADAARLSQTVICCESTVTAICLDGCLARLGLPTAGAAMRALSHPVLQVLPLVLRLCWQPVDPGLLLDFLSLPICPIPPRASRHLAKALTEQPGLGSTAWEAAWQALCDPQTDPAGTLAERLRLWLDVERRNWGERLPASLVKERSSLVARWAHGRARMAEEDEQADSMLADALRIAAVQAAALSDLVSIQGADVSEAQLARLMDAALADGVHIQPCLQAAGGPRLVASLAEITDPCARLVWLGLSTADQPPCHWTALELQQLREEGIDLDDGSRALAALREAERRGLSRVTETLLAIALPDDAEQRPHPLWLQIWQALERAGQKTPVGVEDLLTTSHPMDITPWHFPSSVTNIHPPQPGRPLWTVGPGLLRDRMRSSASELESRLACPLQWVFKYGARLQSSPISRLPGDFQLKGNFCHHLLRAVFGAGGPVPGTPAAERLITQAFEARLPLDAAPLAQPARLAEKLQLRDELLRATRTLVQALRAGGYGIEGFEVPLQGAIRGRSLNGSIDCLVRRDDGEEAIVDFKYGGIKKYRTLLEEGRAVQLATYAYARSQAGPGAFPAVGYLILSDGILYTPEGSRLRGDGPLQVVEGSSIGAVWAAFATALERAESWLTGDAPIPARPLQDPQDWPSGAEIVLDPPDARGRPAESQRICEYCEYGVLCGLVELT